MPRARAALLRVGVKQAYAPWKLVARKHHVRRTVDLSVQAHSNILHQRLALILQPQRASVRSAQD
jgi:hypothetical protein